MEDFNSLGLPQLLMDSIAQLNYTKPTPIQAAAIPMALDGKDILGTAQTGTGKTAAFGIPLIAKLLNSEDGTALVVTPTRELATQVLESLKGMLGKESGIKTALIIGGQSVRVQIKQLKATPRIFVGTPGRINDLLNQKKLKLHNTDYLVLDETDRMLDMGFSIQINEILKHLPKRRQTLLFSATLPKNIVKMSESYMHNAERIEVGSTSAPAKKIKQSTVFTSESDKYGELIKNLEKNEGTTIVFVKTKFGADKMAKRLRAHKISSDSLHGNLAHNKRERVTRAFRDQKFRVLVATDIAARGLDIPHVELVINYDLPMCPEDYIHRIGRTARAEKEGEAINLVSPGDRGKLRAIQLLMDPNSKDTGPKYSKPKGKKRSFSKGGFSGRRDYGPRSGGSREGARSGGSRSGGPRSEGSRFGGQKSRSGESRHANGDRPSRQGESSARSGGPRRGGFSENTRSGENSRGPVARTGGPRKRFGGGKNSSRPTNRSGSNYSQSGNRSRKPASNNS